MENDATMPLVDEPHAPEIFATNPAGFLNLRGTIVITLEALKSDYSTDPGTLSRVVSGRLILTTDGAHALAVGLFDFLKKQEAGLNGPEGAGSVQ